MSNSDLKFITEDGKEFEVPLDGSLGLLALGHVGLMAWREKRHQAGYDLVGIKEKEWEELSAAHEKQVEKMKERRKRILEEREKNQKKDKDS